MKHRVMIQNARSKADRFFRSGFAFVVVLAFFIGTAGYAVHFVNTAKQKEEKAKAGFFEMIEIEMAKCARIGVKMQYAGAQIEEKLLPELKTYLYSLDCMMNAFQSSFGDAASPLKRHYLSKTITSAERLEMHYRSGYPAKDAEDALCHCLDEFSIILKNQNPER